LMILLNEMEKNREQCTGATVKKFLLVLSPFAPHITEELWQLLGEKSAKWRSVHLESWPKYDKRKIIDTTFTLVVQINGKVRDSFEVLQHATQKEIEMLAFSRDHIKQALGNIPVKKVIFVPGRLINMVT